MMNTMAKPLKNTQHEIEIVDVTAKGFGVGYINGFTLFVDGSLPGDFLRVHVIKVKTRYGYGKILEILKPSLGRIESPCAVFAQCGGCQFQNYDYNAQLALKKRVVFDALKRIGGVDNPPVADVIGMDAPVRYRNKAVFPVVPTPDGFAIGMYAARSHRIIAVADCIIQHEAHIPVLEILQKHMQAHKMTAYDETTHAGLVRHIMIRTSLATNEVMVVLVINGDTFPAEREFCEKLTQCGATTVVVNVNKSRGNTILGNHFRVLHGTGFIREKIGHVEYQISAPSFFQVNPVQTKVLYDAALKQADLHGTEVVLDAHVGAGGVALYAANHAQSIIGVDIVQPAITDAIKNAEINGIQNAKFVCGAAEVVIPEMLTSETPLRPDVVFLDPPRKGCETVLLDAIIDAQIKKIVYISCDPATLARDIKRLIAGGYALVAAQPVDMFPMTGKVETTVLLSI